MVPQVTVIHTVRASNKKKRGGLPIREMIDTDTYGKMKRHVRAREGGKGRERDEQPREGGTEGRGEGESLN